MFVDMNLKNIHIDKIESIYLKDKEGNMVELFKGKNFSYDYSCNSQGKRKLSINCDMSDRSTCTMTITPDSLHLEGWAVPNNTFDRAYSHAEGHASFAEGNVSK